MIAVVASAVDDPAWVNGRGYLTDGLVWLGLLGVAVGFIGPKVGWGRWTTHAVGALFAGLLIPIVAGWAEYPGLSIGQTFGHTAYGAIQAYLDIAWRQIRVHHPGGPLRRGPRDHHVGHRPVRLVRGVRAPPAAERRDRARDRPPREHVVDVPRGAAVPRRVHGRGPVPAHPDARVRRARDVDPAPDRRPEHHLVPLPARRDRVHPRGHARLVAADEPRGLEPAGGRVGPGPRPAHRGRGDARPVPARGRRRQGHGRDLRGRGQDRRQVVQRRRHRVHRDPARDREEGRQPLLARGHVQLASSSADGTRPTRAASTSRPAAQLLAGSEDVPTPGIIAQGPDHDPPRGLPRQRAAGARLGDQRGPAGHGAPDRRGRLVHRGRGAARHRPVHGRQRRARAAPTSRRSAATC